MPKHFVILVAEDEETDALLLRRAFQRAGLPHRVLMVRDGQEAVDYLKGDAPFTDRLEYPWPHLLLLDLKMPRMNGFDLLSWIQHRPELRPLPCLVLTSSSSQMDIDKAKQLGAVEYIVKPHVFTDLLRLVHDLTIRWGQEALRANKILER